VAFTDKKTTVEEVNRCLEEAANTTMKGILGYETNQLVSVDFRGDARSSIVDAPLTTVVAGNCVKVISWYDNEWGYSCRVRDLIKFMAQKGL
jgi:glyceraldehyde 3-phosphate dehydrogenase